MSSCILFIGVYNNFRNDVILQQYNPDELQGRFLRTTITIISFDVSKIRRNFRRRFYTGLISSDLNSFKLTLLVLKRIKLVVTMGSELQELRRWFNFSGLSLFEIFELTLFLKVATEALVAKRSALAAWMNDRGILNIALSCKAATVNQQLV